MKIHKYHLEYGTNRIQCHRGQWISTAIDPTGVLAAWREEADNGIERPVDEIVYVRFTGESPPSTTHLGTVVQGALVYHVYV